MLKSGEIEMKRIGLLIFLVVLAADSIWGEVIEILDLNPRTELEKALGENVGDSVIIASDQQNRSYPSIFQAWNGIENGADEDVISLLARHDLAFAHPHALLGITWNISQDQPYQGLEIDLNPDQLNIARKRKQQLLFLNSNLRLLVELRFRDAPYLSETNEKTVEHWWQVGFYPPNSPFWLKDSNGQHVIGWGEDTNVNGKIDQDDKVLHYLIDFTQESVQELIAEKALELKKSGLFDGIMLDWWNEDFATTAEIGDWSRTVLTLEKELTARIAILRKIRSKVGDDFLIMVNSNKRKIPRSASYVNGVFMECDKDKYDRGYNLFEIKEMENALLWAEQNLKQPRINCLEGWRVVTKYNGNRAIRIAERNSALNQKWMRMITSLSLTHSDGYVLFADDNAMPTPDHLHNWYDFWDVNLGYPIGMKAKLFQETEGLFIREFELGWVVYNRSGKTQSINFDEELTKVGHREAKKRHQVENLDGALFQKPQVIEGKNRTRTTKN